MSLCSTCFNADELPICTDEITFGTIETESETVTVYIKNLATGRINEYVGDVDEFGTVTLTTVELPKSLTFELWCTEDGQSINERLPITNGSREYLCIDFKTVSINPSVSYISHDLMITE